MKEIGKCSEGRYNSFVFSGVFIHLTNKRMNDIITLGLTYFNN